ncbi:ABC transporter substrate-binding protein [Bacillus sp. B1-b2]|uniref:ABC transporter substrate-binding protein n=1 Tax=Bacillus sp. B1-b2 TaxID=2653201 RepID=UPI001261EFE4|nr:ABC transporter substrate-binding protein [Bacillus sp. B1-b2]KAB7672179.1 ABC transporter substrate-binding protein [Bacillus sp. B1-b2]
MNSKLLTLWRYYPSGNIRTEEIAETLQLSAKQTTRYLKKWQDEGWITFKSGRGRGNISTIIWKKEVEEVFEEEVLLRMDGETVENSSKFLMYDWSTDSKMRLMNKFQTKLGFIQESKDKLIVPKRYPILTIHPLEAAEVVSANLVATIFNRLVALTEEGEIIPELAHSWDVSSTKLRLYLKKDIAFHDKSILTPHDVKDCLDRLRNHKHYQELWKPIERIEIKGPLIVDLIHPNGCSYTLPLLSMLCASIYRESKDQVIGTGCFSLEENRDHKTTLLAFKEYFQERPLLDAVEFIKVPTDFKGAYHSHLEQTDSTSFQVESDSGFGIVVMNVNRNTDIKRKEVRDYLHWIIAKERDSIHTCNSRMIPNHKSMLVGHHQNIAIQEVPRPMFTEPLVVRGASHTADTTQWLVDILTKENIPIELQWYSFADTVNKEAKTLNVDLFIHGEIFEMNQDFSFFHFLKNGFSPLYHILPDHDELNRLLDSYLHTPFKSWSTLNRKVEKLLIEESIVIPLYYQKRYVPFSSDIMNITIKHFGYVDFSKLWVRPNIDEVE